MVCKNPKIENAPYFQMAHSLLPSLMYIGQTELLPRFSEHLVSQTIYQHRMPLNALGLKPRSRQRSLLSWNSHPSGKGETEIAKEMIS